VKGRNRERSKKQLLFRVFVLSGFRDSLREARLCHSHLTLRHSTTLRNVTPQLQALVGQLGKDRIDGLGVFGQLGILAR
jgi:hypothetical protein